MSKRKTNEEFILEIKSKYQDQVTILTPYIDAKTKVLVRYNNCGHQDYKIPNKLLDGQLCSACRFKRLSETKTKSKEQFENDLLQRGYHFEILSDYLGVDHKVTVRNPKCGHVYEASPKNLLSKGSGCPICHGYKDDTLFRKIIEEKYPGEYTIFDKYEHNLTKIHVRHNRCGYEWNIAPKTLLRQYTCPKCNVSRNEWLLEKYLKSINIDFKREVWFDKCRDKLPLPFDFYIYHNDHIHFIEIDGEHHYDDSDYRGLNDFDTIHKHDMIKNKFCEENGYPLLRLPYYLFNDFSLVESEIKSFLNI